MKKFLPLILALALCAGLSVPALAAGFSDVPAEHYASAAIDTCVGKGIVSGYAGGIFKPAATLTRTQFCVMLCRAFYPGEAAENDSAALREQGWFVPSTYTLHKAGVLEGTSFRDGYNQAETMNQPISRYDMAQLMANIMRAGGKSAGAAEKTAAQAKIKEWSSIPAGYRDAVASCYALELLSGLSDGTFGGGSAMNRAQGCVVIDRMNRYIQPLPTETQTPEPPQTPAAPVKTEEAAAELIRLINARRAKAGLKALDSMDSLDKAAQTRAKDLSGGYVEIRADGSDWTSVLKNTGVPADFVDESFVVGTGITDAEAAMEVVLNTPSATSALMNPEHTHLSVGYVHTSDGFEGYQDFWSLLYIIESGGEAPGETPTVPTPPPAPTGDSLEAMRQGVLELVNAARAQNGKSPLTLRDDLTDVAQLRADEIVQSFSHTRPNGSSCFTAIKEAGISGGDMGENIAAGQSSPASVMDSWMNSEGHRANILSDKYSSIGIGYVKSSSGYGHYWVQMFMG